MASFEFGNALLLQNPLLQSDVLDSTITFVEELSKGYMPFEDTQGKIWIEYNRINSYGSQAAVAVAGTGAVTHSAATFTQIAGRVMTYASQVRIPRVYQGDPIFSAAQIKAKAGDVGRTFGADLGSSAAASDTTLKVPGYGGLVSNGQSLSGGSGAAVSGVLSFEALDRLSDAVKEAGPNKCFIMPARTIRSYRALCRTSGVSPQELIAGDFGTPQLMHNGIPILKNENLATDLTEAGGLLTNRVYCVLFDTVRGMHGFYNGSGVLNIVGPYPVPAAVGDEYSIEFNVGVALKSDLALAQLKGISN